MRILGISASERDWGNTDLLVRHVLRGARGEGATTRFLRLGDLGLLPCSGCMACVFKAPACVLKDRLPELIEALQWAQGVVLGAPTYLLGAAAVVKNLQDRLIRFGVEREFVGKPGVAVAPAGVPGWEPFVLPQLAQTFLFLGMPVVDQFVGYAQGPGEIFDDAAACERALRSGAALGRGDTSFRGDRGACPVCHFDLVTLRQDGSGYCPLCDLPGAWVQEAGRRVFRTEPGAEARWTEARIRHHFVDRILPSGPRFMARKREVVARVKAFRAEDEP